MRSLATVGAKIEQAARAKSQQRQVIVAAGSAEAVDWHEVERLEAEGTQVVLVFTGIPRDPLDPLLEEPAPCDP